MNAFFSWIEDGALSSAIRESPSIFAYPTIIVLHTIGMGFLAGTNMAIDLRVLGLARAVPLAPMAKFLPVFWLAVAVSAVSGLLLLIAYPTKALTNPIFYIKLTLIALALALLRMLTTEIFRNPRADQERMGKKAMVLAAGSLCLWIAAITAGRLLAYTYTWEMVGIRAIL